MKQSVIFSPKPDAALLDMARGLSPDRTFILADSNTGPLCLPLLGSLQESLTPEVFIIPAGEAYKNLDTLASVWEWLSGKGASRASLLINVGGGVVTDLGGFAAATFKRGIRFLNFPTTLLGAADAAVGGKTGIDFLGLKNEVGAFAPADGVVISTAPFATLPHAELLSGFTETMKMAMIADASLYSWIMGRLQESDFVLEPEGCLVKKALRFAVEEKMRITEADPFEKDLRRFLNFGHTAGHAFESLLLGQGRPVTHGCAVAHGILLALILSHLMLKTPSSLIYTYRDGFLRPLFSRLPVSCADCDRVLELMRHDKKSRGGKLVFILLRALGVPEALPVPAHEIHAALDIFADLNA